MHVKARRRSWGPRPAGGGPAEAGEKGRRAAGRGPGVYAGAGVLVGRTGGEGQSAGVPAVAADPSFQLLSFRYT